MAKNYRNSFSAWDESNFTAIAENFGKVLVNASPVWNCSDVSHGKVCILTAIRLKINEVTEVKFGDSLFKIGVVEFNDDWSPFKMTVSGSELGSSDDEDNDDGVSDTWHKDGMDLEEGEITVDRNMDYDRGRGSSTIPEVPDDGDKDVTV